MLLTRIYIDGVKAAALVELLRAYRQDEQGKPVKDGVHDHMCDAFRYASLAERERQDWRPVPLYVARTAFHPISHGQVTFRPGPPWR